MDEHVVHLSLEELEEKRQLSEDDELQPNSELEQEFERRLRQ